MVVTGLRMSATGLPHGHDGLVHRGLHARKVFGAKASSSSLLANLPSQPFIFAFALDCSSTARQGVLQGMSPQRTWRAGRRPPRRAPPQPVHGPRDARSRRRPGHAPRLQPRDARRAAACSPPPSSFTKGNPDRLTKEWQAFLTRIYGFETRPSALRCHARPRARRPQALLRMPLAHRPPTNPPLTPGP